MKTEKQNLLHEGLIELIVMVIRVRDKMQELEKDEELDAWKDNLDAFSTDLNEVLAELNEIHGHTVGRRIEIEEDKLQP